MADELGIFEVMYNSRAMRRLKPDAVPEELLVKLIDAANQAPSGSNAQRARWIIVRDAEQKRRLAELNKTAVDAYIGPQSGRAGSLPFDSGLFTRLWLARTHPGRLGKWWPFALSCRPADRR